MIEMNPFKLYTCNNAECVSTFRRSESKCMSRMFCSIECCHEDTIRHEGSLDDLCKCEDCIGGARGSWAYVNDIAVMCGKPAWSDYLDFKAQALVYSILFYPEKILRTAEEIKKAQIIQSLWNTGNLQIRQISRLSDQEIYLEFECFKI